MEVAASRMKRKFRTDYSCGSKRAYSSWAEAERDLKMIRRSDRRNEPGALHIYRCNGCPNFHIGHQQIMQRKGKA